MTGLPNTADPERKAPDNAGQQFRERASLFSGKLFVRIVVYADESGTHDSTGKQDGSDVPVIGGYMAPREEWPKFCDDWQSVLSNHRVPYFHYREWRDAMEAIRQRRALKIKNNPYSRLNECQLNELLYDLAEVAGRQVPCGGYIDLPKFNKLNKGYPYAPLLALFFEDLLVAITEHWPNLRDDIDLFLDQNTDQQWESSFREAHRMFQKKDSRISKIAFVDKKRFPHWPLQAADMFVYRSRQLARPRMLKQQLQSATVLDYILNRNLHPNGLYPVITQELLSEALEAIQKYPSAMRSIFEKIKP
jgi:hypothetical protein